MAVDTSALRQRIIDGAARAVDRATEALRDELQYDAPYRSGDTYRGITAELGQGDATRPSATIRSATPQGNWVNDGTPPHVIFGNPLRFVVGGAVVFARKVNHPGTSPTHWWDNPVSFWPTRVREQFPAAWDG